ncbi:hypothetical protein ACVXHA_01215 [Escherichia coli]
MKWAASVRDLEMLSADEKSEVLAFVSKPPAEAVRLKLLTP